MSDYWMQTYSGIAFDLVEPTPEMVNMLDIAHALSMTCRYNGHTHRFYSTAEHSVHMAKAMREEGLQPELQLGALFHDAHEVYTGDVIRPLKAAGYLNGNLAKQIEARIEDAICEVIDLAPMWLHNTAVKIYDVRILQNERKPLFGPPPRDWDLDDFEPLDTAIECWEPHVARRKFIEFLWVVHPTFVEKHKLETQLAAIESYEVEQGWRAPTDE